MSMRRSASTPTLSSADEACALEVYVATRALQCKLPHVPEALKDGLLRDIGCQHYYTVIRHPRDGTLTSLDFGPIGGRDIAFTPARESLWAWGRKRLARRAVPVPKGTPGEVREMALMELPESSLFVGRTKLSMRDIRSFNSLQNNLYLLHKSDCRHYVNNLVQYATGVEGITRKATREIYTASKSALAWTDRLVLVAHNFTDVGQWPRIQHATQTALAVWAALGGRRYAARWATQLQPALRGLPWRAAAARQAAGGMTAGSSQIVAAKSAGFRAAGCSTALTRAVTAPKPLPSVRAAATAAAGAAAAAAAPEASFLGGIGESLRNTGAVLRAASQKAGSAALAAAAVGTTRLRKGAAVAPRRPVPVRLVPSVQAPVRRRQQRRAGLLVLGSAC